MKHSIYKLSVTSQSTPFPMPPVQREHAMRILVEVARDNGVAPAMLVTHLPQGEDRAHVGVRVLVWRRILDEVDGVSVRMLARAFRRDPHRVRDLLKKNTPVVALATLEPESKNDVVAG